MVPRVGRIYILPLRPEVQSDERGAVTEFALSPRDEVIQQGCWSDAPVLVAV